MPGAPAPRPRRPRLMLHVPWARNTVQVLINGFPATIETWSAEEWSRLAERPPLAQPMPNGSWVELTVD